VVFPNSDPAQNPGSGNPTSPADPQTPVTPQTTAAQPATSVPSPDIQEWEKKYKGLQTLVNKANGERDKAVADLATLQVTVEEQKLKIGTLEKQVTDLTASVGTKEKDVETAKGETTAKTLEVARLKLIVKEYPQLASFEAAGVLPTATTEDEMRTKFKAFQDAMSSIVGEDVKAKLKGSSLPSGTPTSTQPTEDEIYDEMSHIAGVRGKEDEFRKLQKQYDALREARQPN